MWRNQQVYRQTENGKAKRRAQSARHRLRKNERRQQADALPVLPAVLTLPGCNPKLRKDCDRSEKGGTAKVDLILSAFSGDSWWQ